jgi:hypothetical protein
MQVAPQLSSRGWVDPVPDPLLLRKCVSVGNRTRDLWICSQELWTLDHRGGLICSSPVFISQWSVSNNFYSLITNYNAQMIHKNYNQKPWYIKQGFNVEKLIRTRGSMHWYDTIFLRLPSVRRYSSDHILPAPWWSKPHQPVMRQFVLPLPASAVSGMDAGE